MTYLITNYCDVMCHLLYSISESESIENRRFRFAMPTLNVTTNCSVDRVVQSDFVKGASALIASLIGKPEAFVMVTLNSGVTMAFAGTEEPAAFAQIISIGAIGGDKNKTISAGLCEYLHKKLSVPPNRTYIHFVDVARSDFGFNATTFEK